jgi:hypothetical protein
LVCEGEESPGQIMEIGAIGRGSCAKRDVIANAKRQTTQNKNCNFDKWKINL